MICIDILTIYVFPVTKGVKIDQHENSSFNRFANEPFFLRICEKVSVNYVTIILLNTEELSKRIFPLMILLFSYQTIRFCKLVS